jgi:hypothetical protein
MADQQAGGLLTLEEFQAYALKADNGITDMWMPARRADGQEGEWV